MNVNVTNRVHLKQAIEELEETPGILGVSKNI